MEEEAQNSRKYGSEICQQRIKEMVSECFLVAKI